jgi:hypothetical protein
VSSSGSDSSPPPYWFVVSITVLPSSPPPASSTAALGVGAEDLDTPHVQIADAPIGGVKHRAPPGSIRRRR